MYDLIIFDLDGTLVEDHLIDTPAGLKPRTDRHYTEVVPLAGARERVREIGPEARFAIATNQGGVALGFQVEQEVRTRIAAALMAFDYFDGRPFSIHYCTHHPAAHDEKLRLPDQLRRRKPNGGMLEEACDLHHAPRSLMIGDRDTDRAAAEAAGIDYLDVKDWLNGVPGL